MRLAGILLACVGGAFIYEFTQKPTGGIPGFPQAWRGGPLLLGASFFGINGFYLILQKRFSLGALLVAGIVSAALTSVTHAYVRSIRATSAVRTTLDLPSEKLTEFIAKSHEMLPPDALRQFVEDARTSGRLQSNVGFDSAIISFRLMKAVQECPDTDHKTVQITVSLNFEFCPYVDSAIDDSKRTAEEYSCFIHRYIQKSNTIPPDPRMVALGFDRIPDLEITGDILSLLNSVGKSNQRRRPTSSGLMPFDRDGLVWLRDRERNAEIKRFLAETLLEYDKLHAKIHYAISPAPSYPSTRR
jgi:hypothetical protein